MFDLLTMIEVVGQRRIDIGQRNARKHIDDFIRAVAPHFVPDHDVLHADAMAGNAGPSAANTWRFCDVLCDHIFHKTPRIIGRGLVGIPL